MSREAVRRRIRDLQEALEEDPRELATGGSADSIRSSSSGLATVPFLTINDIILLRDLGISSLDELEANMVEVPDPVWPHVLALVEARVLDPASSMSSAASRAAGANGDGEGRCLALTKAGVRCRNNAREGSKYCSSHKGYQPSPEELEARRKGLLPEA